jgi:hypothetical protein
MIRRDHEIAADDDVRTSSAREARASCVIDPVGATSIRLPLAIWRRQNRNRATP